MTNLADIVTDSAVTVRELRQAYSHLARIDAARSVGDVVVRAHPADELAFRNMPGFRHEIQYTSDEMDVAKPNEIGKIDGFHIVMDHRRVPGSILVTGSRAHGVTISMPRSA